LLYSGGETVMDLLEQLLTDDLPWRNVHIFVEQNCPERLAVVLDISKRLSSIK
jgi:6-phosphogluconolactonase/glucosamine-6-phosphate isomerase/deaminase